MGAQIIEKLLKGNSYPGRGIILGLAPDAQTSVLAYFIMGRSTNSRNRVFVGTEDGIKTQAFDPSMMSDPSLIIYHPVRELDGLTIVTNGDQTDTVRDHLVSGGTFESALRTREFEPDPPNYTPRISGLLSTDGSYRLSILKSLDGDPSCCCRYFYEYDRPIAGTGHFIHTYVGDGNPLPSFIGDPEKVLIPCSDAHELADLIWDSLNGDNKVSLYVRTSRRGSGAKEEVIINANEAGRQ